HGDARVSQPASPLALPPPPLPPPPLPSPPLLPPLLLPDAGGDLGALAVSALWPLGLRLRTVPPRLALSSSSALASPSAAQHQQTQTPPPPPLSSTLDRSSARVHAREAAQLSA